MTNDLPNENGLSVEVSGCTDIGKRRIRNEDSLAVNQWCSSPDQSNYQTNTLSLNTPVLIAIADGMGGHAAGDVASSIVTQNLISTEWTENFQQEISAVLAAIQKELSDRMRDEQQLQGMGSTVAGVLLLGRTLFHFNVGDSRVYLISKAQVTQLSTDDSLFSSHRLTQALGGLSGVLDPVDHHGASMQIEPGDTIMICSDGLSNLVKDDEFANLDSISPEMATNQLLALALERGGFDNVSVIVASVITG